MTCEAKHTKYQPTNEEWKCPKCGAKSFNETIQKDGWIVDEFDESADCECNLLHDLDELFCWICGYCSTGKSFAAKVAKEKKLVTCPCCKGKGLVDPKKVKQNE